MICRNNFRVPLVEGKYGLKKFTDDKVLAHSDKVLAHASWFSLYDLYKLSLLLLAPKCFYGIAGLSLSKNILRSM